MWTDKFWDLKAFVPPRGQLFSHLFSSRWLGTVPLVVNACGQCEGLSKCLVCCRNLAALEGYGVTCLEVIISGCGGVGFHGHN